MLTISCDKAAGLRAVLLAAALVLGAAAAALAQEPDSVLVVKKDGKNLLRLNTDAGFVVRGTPEVGAIPATGTGVRMMWFPARWAFRVGKVDTYGSHYWNLNEIGTGSVALGENVRAPGNHSLAANIASTASGIASVALGSYSTASGDRSFAVNGEASGEGSVALGSEAWATGDFALALGHAPISRGYGSIVLGPNEADGSYAVAIGGWRNSASGERSIAIGNNARTANRRGSIVLGDGCASFNADSVYPTAHDQIVMRGCGGIKLYTDQGLTAGVELAAGGSSWLQVSDVNRKENFEALDGEEVLVRLREVPVMTWNYRSQDAEIRHAGPTAQDFRAAFGLGESELMINTIDIDGINLAAVRALEARSTAQRELIDSLRDEITVFRARDAEREAELAALKERDTKQQEAISALEARLARLEALLGGGQTAVGEGTAPRTAAP